MALLRNCNLLSTSTYDGVIHVGTHLESFTASDKISIIFQENLRSFEGPGFEDLRATNNRKISTFSNRFVSREYLNIDLEKIWQILEDPHSSQIARVCKINKCFTNL